MMCAKFLLEVLEFLFYLGRYMIVIPFPYFIILIIW